LGKTILYRFQVKPKIGNLFCLLFVSFYPFPVIPVLGKFPDHFLPISAQGLPALLRRVLPAGSVAGLSAVLMAG